jgi:general stress protein YciG
MTQPRRTGETGMGVRVQMTNKHQGHQCKAKTKARKRCRAAATAGGLCFFHANPDKASELGRIGGRSKRHAAAGSNDPLPTLDNAIAVRDTVARLVADVYAGRLHPRIAAGLAPLMNLQLRAIETTNIEQRLTKLEKRLGEADGELDDNTQGPVLERRDPRVDPVPANPVAEKGVKANGFADGSNINKEQIDMP